MSSAEQLDEMGPIDYIVLEWPGRQPTGEVAPLILDLVDRGIIRILDIAFMVKDEDGTVAAIDLGRRGRRRAPASPSSKARRPACSARRTSQEAAAALEPGTSAAVLVWENRWAAPVAVALRKSGGQLVASGRIPVQAILASLEALEATELKEEPSMPGLAPRRRPHRRHRRHRDLRQQPRLAPPGQPLVAAGASSVRGAARSSSTRPPPPAAAPAPDPIEQLKQLGALQEQGILTDEEFSAQKAKILG